MKAHIAVLALALLAGALPASAGPNSNLPPGENPTDAANKRMNKRAEKADAKVTHAWRKGRDETKSGAKKAGRATGRGLQKTGEKIDEGGKKLQDKSR